MPIIRDTITKHFRLFFWLIIIFGLVLRLVPDWHNNFYFTMDQAETALQMREIVERGAIPLKGSPASIDGIYTGPLWYWYTSVFYFLFRGHPFAGIAGLIVINLVVTAIVMKKLSKAISPIWGLVIGFLVQIFWPFYDTSRYAFNPFPMAGVIILATLFLVDFWQGKNRAIVYAGAMVGLVIHLELASFIPIFIWLVIFGSTITIVKKISVIYLTGSAFAIMVNLTPHLVSEIANNFEQTRVLLSSMNNPSGVFVGNKINEVLLKFLHIVSGSMIPQSTIAGLIGYLLMTSLTIFVLFVYKKRGNSDIYQYMGSFYILSLCLLVISLIFFVTNKGLSEWHLVYLPTLLFVANVLFASQLPHKLGILLTLSLLTSQLIIFNSRYLENLRSSPDQSMLANELAAIDWTYNNSDNKGFYVYSYLPSVLDKPYQYLYPWYGKRKYGYLPCEYASFPGSPKLFVPGESYYREPMRECGNIRFLIIEPDKNDQVRDNWFRLVSENTSLIKQENIGNILVQMRKEQK